MPPPEVLTNANFLLFCAKFYSNPHCTSYEEFLNDVRRLKHIKKLITRYEKTGEFKTRLILNHIIILNNCFGNEAACKIMWLKMGKHLRYIKPFLILLNTLPDILYDIEAKGPIYTDEIEMDQHVINSLREI